MKWKQITPFPVEISLGDGVPPVRSVSYHGPFPPERKPVLLLLETHDESRGVPRHVAVGTFRYAAGEKDSPCFTIPGLGGVVIAWSDCLGDEFQWPKNMDPQ